MTRGKWVALAVGLAVIAVLVPYGPAVWRAVAYERHTMFGRPQDTSWSMYFCQKRYSWLPGSPQFVPPQPCGRCRNQDHGRCIAEESDRLFGSGTVITFTGTHLSYEKTRHASAVVLVPLSAARPMVWRCTCPHPSHAGNSE